MSQSALPVLDPLPPVLSKCTLNLLAGASGVGKTSLIAYMASCLIHGVPLFDRQPTAIPKVAYIGADRPWTGDTELWFNAYGIPDIAHYSLIEDDGFEMSRFLLPKSGMHASIFADILDGLELPPGSVVFADPIAMFIGGDQNHYIRVATGCVNLYKVIRKRQLCVVGVDHSSKQKGDSDSRYTRLQDRISGSMAKLGYTATQMYLAGPEEMNEDCHTFLWNPHHAKSQTFKLHQNPLDGTFAYTGETPEHRTATPAPPHTPEGELSPAVQSLLLCIPAAPSFISTATLIQQSDTASRATIYRYLKELEAARLVAQLGRGIWQRTAPDSPLLDAIHAGESDDES